MSDRLSVVVVDDDSDTADSLATLLDLLGYNTRAAYGGVQALEMAVGDFPDVVILDLLMPGMDGWELACRLRASARRPLLIAITGSHEPDARQRAIEAGIHLFLVKPVQLCVLTDVLEKFWRVIGPVVV